MTKLWIGSKGIRSGFTLLEVMIAVGLFSLVMAGVFSVFIMCQKLWHATSLNMLATREANMALSRMVYGVGTNNGLRAAANVIIDSNYIGTWTGGTNYPPSAGASTHYLTTGPPDGSWRMTCSNTFDGIKWMDYNKKASNIIYWTDTNSSSSRQPVCNYVSNAVVSTNASGVNIQLTIFRKEGRFTSTNQMSTFVQLRNMK